MNGLIQNSTTFGIVISIIGYEIGLLLRKKFNLAILNPLLISIVFVIVGISAVHIDYKAYNHSAQYLSYLLTPATVSLAIPLYKNLKILQKNGILGSIVSVTVFKFFRIVNPIAKGIALGTTSHAVGTAKAMEMGEVEGSVSSLAMIVCGILTLVGVSVFANFV